MSGNDRTRGKDLKEQVKKREKSKVSAPEWQEKKNPLNLESFSALRNVSDNKKSGIIQGSDYEKFSIL